LTVAALLWVLTRPDVSRALRPVVIGLLLFTCYEPVLFRAIVLTSVTSLFIRTVLTCGIGAVTLVLFRMCLKGH
jgi:hypothetical protein